MGFFCMVFTLKRLANEYGGQVGKNESLQKRNQHFNKIYKYGKCNG